jgi:N-acetyl-gamma-glutamylphosphate reductase
MPTQINKKVMILGADGLCGKSLLSILKRLYDIKDLILIDPSDESKPPIIIAKPESKDLWNVVSSMQ